MILNNVYLMVFSDGTGIGMGVQYRSNPINHVFQNIKKIDGLAVAVPEDDFTMLKGSVIDHDGITFTIKTKDRGEE
jgi:hypothetical protein